MNPTIRSISANELLADEPAAQIVGTYFREDESKVLRVLGTQLAEIAQHFRDRNVASTARPFLCNGPNCVACLAGKAPVTMFLLPALLIASRTVCALSIGEASGPDSLRRLIAQVLRLPDITQKIIEITLRKRKYSLKILRTIAPEEDNERFGLDIIRDVVERNLVTPEALAATVDQVANADLLDEWPSLRAEVELRHPGLDVDAL